MSHIVTLELPDEVFADLQSSAQLLGVEVADLCLSRLQNGARVEDDPFWKLAGAFDSATPDLAERHDFYLAQEMLNRHDDEK